MFNEIYSDSWLQEKDVNIDLTRSSNNSINPIAAIKILNGVKKIVNIVHGSGKYKVIFRAQEDTAYINYSERTIVISSQLLKNPNSNYTLYDIIDIETGLALHESGHAEHTPDPTSQSNKELYAKLNSNIKHNIHNIIEDAIMEQIVANDFPGYSGYFIKLRNHYFKHSSIQVSGNGNADRINELLIGLRYTGDAKIFDPLAIEAVNLVKDIMSLPNNELKKVDRVELAEKVYNMIIIPEPTFNAKNNQEIEPNDFDLDIDDEPGISMQGGDGSSFSSGESDNTKEDEEDMDNNSSGGDGDSDKESDKESDNEDSKYNSETGGKASGDYDLSDDEIGGEFKDFLDKKQEELDTKLDKSEDALINNMMDEDLSESELETPYGRRFNVISCKPKVIPGDINLYKKSLKDVNKLIIKFRNKFSDANTIYKQNAYGLSRGNLDEDNLYSAKYNRNIFMNNVVTTKSRTKNIDIAFTIDCSGSMWETLDRKTRKKRIDVARDLATLFTEALSPINSINTWVFGFQDAYDYFNRQTWRVPGSFDTFDLPEEERKKMISSTILINLYSPGMKTKHSIGSLSPAGYTPEYEGLSETVNTLMKQGRKDSKKIVVMLTDGAPYSRNLGDLQQISAIKDKLAECKKKDITVIHLALTTEADRTPYANKVRWKRDKGYEGLVDGFIKMLQKQIS